MGTLDCVNLRQLRKLLKKQGFIETRQKGSHLIVEKAGLSRPIVIPIHGKEVFLYNIKEIMKVLNMNRDEFVKELNEI
ncbi:MAG: type II toxin-antitoxin system HicA family toxin [Endomicrobium sp.]|jgi:predicted RNA binding protein YcfA (HicA-like mRNA interferase family)|nr:type II toxin-antitoxin system HicA family toxin [Endomicrobium sp.]